MAKFAIAVCILLVACCTTATTTESDQVNSMIEKFSKLTEEAVQTLSNKRAELYATVQTSFDEINNFTDNFIEQHNEKLAEITQSVAGDAATCLASSGNFTETIQAVTSDVIFCIREALTNAWDKYRTAKTSVQEFQELITSIQEKADKCESMGPISSALCLGQLWASSQGDVAKQSIAVLANVTKFVTSVTSLPDEVRNCAAITTVTTLATEAMEYYTEFKECIANLNSTADA